MVKLAPPPPNTIKEYFTPIRWFLILSCSPIKLGLVFFLSRSCDVLLTSTKHLLTFIYAQFCDKTAKNGDPYPFGAPQ